MTDDYKERDGQDKPTSIKSVITVSPQHSLWFAWANAGFQGPKGETSKPPFDVSNGHTHLTITVVSPDARWGHSPDVSRHSGPNGLDGSDGTPVDLRGLEIPAYKTDPDYNSLNIKELNIHLNKLVAMFGTAEAPTSEVEQIPIGSGRPRMPVPNGADRVFLGFHDGHEWSNNHGDSMLVELLWES